MIYSIFSYTATLTLCTVHTYTLVHKLVNSKHANSINYRFIVNLKVILMYHIKNVQNLNFI